MRIGFPQKTWLDRAALSATDKKAIRRVVKKSRDPRAICRANALHMRDRGFTAVETAESLNISPRTVFNIQKNYDDGARKRNAKALDRNSERNHMNKRASIRAFAMDATVRTIFSAR